MPDNILRVGAEFDVSQIVAGTQVAVNSFEQMKAKLLALAVEAETAGRSMDAQAARLMASGLSAADATSALVNLGVSEKDAALAIAVASKAIEEQTVAFHTQAAAANASAAATGRAVSAMGAARVEAGALTGSTGMMVGGLARVAAQSAALSPLITAAFPIFAAFAFVDILVHIYEAFKKATDAVMGYTDEVQKAEKANIKFSQSAETAAVSVADAYRKITGEIRTIGEEAGKTWSEKAEKGVQVADEQRTHWQSLFGPLGQVYQEYQYIKAAIDGVADSANKETRALENSIKLQAEAQRLAGEDLRVKLKVAEGEESAAKVGETRITQIHQEIAALKEKQSIEEQIAVRRAAEEVITKGGDFSQAAARARLQVQQETAPKILEAERQLSVAELSLSIATQTAILEGERKLQEARIVMREQFAKGELSLGKITLEQEIAALVTGENEKFALEQRTLIRRRELLERDRATGKETGPQIEVLNKEIETLAVTHQTKLSSIQETAERERTKRDLENVETQINAAHLLSEAQIRLEEDRAKRVFSKADTPKEIEQDALPVIKEINRQYDDQIAKLKERAAVLASTAKAPGAKVTAEAGTPEFDQQVAAIDKAAPEIYRKELEISAEIKRLTLERADAIEKVELEKAEKIKAILAKELEDQIHAISDELLSEEEAYRENMTHIQELFTERKLTLGEYISVAKLFAQEELDARVATLEKERAALKAARDADIITEEQYTRKLEALATEQTRFREQKEAEVSRFTKEEISKREQALHAEVTKMADEFASGINKMITHEQSFGRSLAQMALQIELNLIDQGIKRVAVKYGEEFAKMIASHLGFITKFIADHSSFLATVLGIETTNKAAKAAVAKTADTAEVMADSGLSFAAGFASVMEALPFPVNVATAPGVAASAAAATIAGGIVFEKGGIMPEGHVPAFVRPQEAVLPVGLTQSLTGAVPAINNFNRFVKGDGGIASAASSGGGSTSYKTTHNHFRMEFHDHGSGIDKNQVIQFVKAGVRAGEIRLRDL